MEMALSHSIGNRDEFVTSQYSHNKKHRVYPFLALQSIIETLQNKFNGELALSLPTTIVFVITRSSFAPSIYT